jgi:hypothetical protein
VSVETKVDPSVEFGNSEEESRLTASSHSASERSDHDGTVEPHLEKGSVREVFTSRKEEGKLTGTSL